MPDSVVPMITNTAAFALGVSLTALLLTACEGETASIPKAENVAPIVAAAAEVPVTATLELHGKVADDTLPMGWLMTRWTKVTGPGSVTFGDPLAVNTSASFTEPGIYVLRLTARDGQFTVSDDVTVTVKR